MPQPILIVLFNPSDSAINRISNLRNFFDIYLFDNSPKALEELKDSPNYYHAKCNAGITGAMKWMLLNCEKYLLESFVFFDQDTIFTRQTIEYISVKVNQTNSKYGLLHFSSGCHGSSSVRYVINSGTVFFHRVVQDFEGVFDRYFVDAVDLAICYHLRRAGYLIGREWAPNIDHESEQGIVEWRICGIPFRGKKYPEVRRFEFYRAHKRLILDCIKRASLLDVFILLKFTVSFWVEQLKCDFLDIFANKK